MYQFLILNFIYSQQNKAQFKYFNIRQETYYHIDNFDCKINVK